MSSTAVENGGVPLSQAEKTASENREFRYPEERVVLEHLDLTVTPGERTAIVGRSSE